MPFSSIREAYLFLQKPKHGYGWTYGVEIPTLATGGVQTSVQAPHVYIQSAQ